MTNKCPCGREMPTIAKLSDQRPPEPGPDWVEVYRCTCGLWWERRDVALGEGMSKTEIRRMRPAETGR